MTHNCFVHPNFGFFVLQDVHPEASISKIRGLLFWKLKFSLERVGLSEADLHPYKPKELKRKGMGDDSAHRYVEQNYRSEDWKIDGEVDLEDIFGPEELDMSYVHLVFVAERSDVSDLFSKVHAIAWGKPLEEQFTSLPSELSSPPDFAWSTSTSARGDLLSESPFLATPLLANQNEFLVRAEYIRIYEFFEKSFANRTSALPPLALVTGQPGIGKTVWIRYALHRRLGNKLPTYLLLGEHLLFFDKSGVHYVPKSRQMFFSKRTDEVPWCLVDSAWMDSDHIPSTLTGELQVGINTVYVSSLAGERWRKLDRSRTRYTVIMNPWTWDEILCASRRFHGTCNLIELRRRYDELGPTVRICHEYEDKRIALYKEECQQAINGASDPIGELVAVAYAGVALEGSTHEAGMLGKLCLIWRKDMSSCGAYGGHHQRIVSHYVSDLYVTRFQEIDDKKLLSVWYRSSKRRGVREVIGPVLEAYVHKRFRRKIKFVGEEMFYHHDDECRAGFCARIGLPNWTGSRKLEKFAIDFRPKFVTTFSGDEKVIKVQPDVYYQPLNKQKVGIGSFFVHGKYLYLLQMTGWAAHEVEDTLRNFLARLLDIPNESKWRFVVVVPKLLPRHDFPAPAISVGTLFAGRIAMSI